MPIGAHAPRWIGTVPLGILAPGPCTPRQCPALIQHQHDHLICRGNAAFGQALCDRFHRRRFAMHQKQTPGNTPARSQSAHQFRRIRMTGEVTYFGNMRLHPESLTLDADFALAFLQ